ncbi:zinc finger CCCH domain-containing protein 65 [Phtheirospermum japonicum]|uniref:Zinc finger CCCH domain-containing protein 65 n=1 Tax=Phtheirospermum japonicum TaxID=374723 RepID=A0A830B9V9_9LAMI|nr:zinc finger CCCH domain-containing protein 65 [Phtheirospermum japonicum]
MEELVVDEEFSIADYSEVLDSCFGMDMVIEPSKRAYSEENGTVLEDNIFKEAEHELQLKEMELEKLIFSSGAVNSSSCQNANEEIEEGEISGEAGVADASFDALNEDMVHASEDYFNKEELTHNDNEDRGCRQHQMSDPSLINVVNNDCNSMKVGSRTTDGDFQENAAENQMAATFEKDGDVKGKKRKNGLMTKERRAKKKKKERLKRAEKNRQLGVKRLKLQPVLKPKTVSYCRHYLHGRCHEGEKCKFSHDTVPLTKLKPCGHFARHCCMKGNDCPFDHQLSKYPCKNYTANGFCSRGSDCLFSHNMPANQSLSMTPTASKPELTPAQNTVPDKGVSSSKVRKPEVNLSSPLNKSNSSKQTGNHGIFHQKVDAKNAEQPAERTVPGTAGLAPKGINFLSNVNIGCKTTLGVNKLNEKSKERVAPRKPQGINFLSFARPTSDNSSSKMFSKLLSNSNNETRKSIMDDTGEGIPTCSLPVSSGILKVNTQMNQSATILVRDLSEKVNGTLPQQRNFLSLDKTRLDDQIINERANFRYKKGGSDLPSVNERQSTSSGLSANLSTSFKTSFLSNTPSSVQKAVQSTLAFAANFEPEIRVGSSLHQQEARNSQVGSVMP